jgi:hypothetical protein
MTDAAGNKVQKAYRYGTNGSYELTSNPYTNTSYAGGDPTMGWTVAVRDSMGRVTGVQNYAGTAPGAGLTAAPNVVLNPTGPWGNNTTTDGVTTAAYNVQGISGCNSLGIANQTVDGFGNAQTNPAPYTHSNCFDGLGRVTAVVEPAVLDPSGSVISHATSYAYDVLDDLVSVNMGSL